ncbi:hypothetical protein [Pseudanabaena sp. PCC 6802]|uniref:hypothetical protein n=1 Tax=Pseudanabaena sp. PCC 6802 TaxID=118173 RepID=UPI00034A60D4|nr:hypothetical protein [Pseudanabaena sp. PCC 6802]
MTKAKLVWVAMAAPYADIKYAFKTTADSGVSTALGHTAVDANTAVQGLIYKANHPKPRKASRTRTTGIESSYVSFAKEDDAAKAGWDISRAKSKGRKATTQRQKAVYVTLIGVKYAWAMSLKRWNVISGSAKALGIKEVTGAETDLVFGASFPRPPRVKGSVAKGEESAKFSTFYDPSAKVPTGFSTSAGTYQQGDLTLIL